MQYYRLYFMGKRTGHIVEFVEYEANDDDHAVVQANALRRLCPMELWSGGKKIKRWEALPPVMAA